MLATFRSVPLILVAESNLTYMYISSPGSLWGKLIEVPHLSQIYVPMILAFGILYGLEF